MSSLLEATSSGVNFTQNYFEFYCLFFCSFAKGTLEISSRFFTSGTFPAFSSLTWHILILSASSLSQLCFSSHALTHLSFYQPSLTPSLFNLSLPYLYPCLSSHHHPDLHLSIQPSTLTHLRFARSVSPVEFSQLPFPLSVPTYHGAHNSRILLLCECVCKQTSVSVFLCMDTHRRTSSSLCFWLSSKLGVDWSVDAVTTTPSAMKRHSMVGLESLCVSVCVRSLNTALLTCPCSRPSNLC